MLLKIDVSVYARIAKEYAVYKLINLILQRDMLMHLLNLKSPKNFGTFLDKHSEQYLIIQF